VRYINKKKKQNRILLIFMMMVVIAMMVVSCQSVDHRTIAADNIRAYELQHFNRSLMRQTMFAANLAVTTTDVGMGDFTLSPDIYAALLVDVNNRSVLYGKNLFASLYPASTTKLMTAYLTFRYGNLEDMVTVSERAVAFDWTVQLGGFQAGDTVSLFDLLCGMILHSGNDNSVAIAEHIAGSEEAFVQLMNEEAKRIGATRTTFVNSHGLHDANQVTTAYDLYLIFNVLLQDQRFVDIIQMPYHTAQVTDVHGNVRPITSFPTNWYTGGLIGNPYNVSVLGGKTGTTDQAGACVILLNRDINNRSFISIIMGAPSRDVLYENMTNMLHYGINNR